MGNSVSTPALPRYTESVSTVACFWKSLEKAWVKKRKQRSERPWKVFAFNVS